MANQDYQSIYHGTEMDDRWGKAGRAVQGADVNGSAVPKDSDNILHFIADKTTVGLGNVDNTSDADKPVSTATQEAIEEMGEAKQDKTDESLQTTSKQVVGAINELNSGKAPANLVPAQASPTNQLADKDFVNSSINAFAAFYITSDAEGDAFATKAALLAGPYYNGGQLRTPTKNDYAIVLADESKGGATTRYSYDGNAWAYQYKVNDTPLTSAQLAALNSGITAGAVALIPSQTKQDGWDGKQDELTEQQLANIEAVPGKADDSVVLKRVAQSLSDSEKAQARQNIGAESAGNKETTLSPASDTKFPTSKAVADYVGDSIPTKVSDLTNDSGFLTLATLPIYDGGVSDGN